MIQWKKIITFTSLAIVSGLVIFSTIKHNKKSTKVSAANECTINTSVTHQTIRGFGGMNHPEWAGDLTSSQRDMAFSNGNNQLGLSVLRIFVNEDSSQWSRALPTAKQAIANGAIVFASPWNPPSSMVEYFNKDNNASTGTNGNEAKRLKHSSYAAYTQHLNNFVTYMKNNGVDLYAISIQNEPDYAFDWTWWTADECLDFMVNYAGSINCRVISPETFQYNKTYYDKILNNTTAFNNTDIFATHFYGTSRNNMAYPLLKQKGNGKEVWMSEVYVPNSDSNSADRWPEAIDVSKNIHNGLVVGDMSSYVWWYIRRSYGLIKEDSTISKRGYCMAQYSKYVRPGYVRVDATESPESNIYVSAYKGDGKITIVAINSSSNDITQHFAFSNEKISTVNRYRTSSSENLALTSNMENNGSDFWSSLPANSVSTFVATIGTNTSTPTIAPTTASVTSTTAPTATPTAAVTSAPVVTATASSVDTNKDVTAVFKILNDWGSGCTGSITFTNNTGKAFTNGWTFEFDFNRNISSLWNGTLKSSSNNHYVVTNPAWAPSLGIGESYTINFLAGAANGNDSVLNCTLK